MGWIDSDPIPRDGKFRSGHFPIYYIRGSVSAQEQLGMLGFIAVKLRIIKLRECFHAQLSID
jgi:hypothetical protein